MATKIENAELDEEMNEFSLLLTTFPHVVAVVLSYMNAKDLNSCSRVCTLWSKVAKNLKKHRRTRAWNCFILNGVEEDQIMEEMKDFICNLYTEPKTVFMFWESDLHDYDRLGDFVISCLPSECTLVAVTSGGVVGTSPDQTKIYEIENSGGVSMLCLPEYDGVDIASRILNETDHEREDTATDYLPIQITDNCKAVFMFMSDMEISRHIGLDLVDTLSSSLVAGGYVDSIISGDRDEDCHTLQCVTLCGDNVSVASVLINSNINSPSKVEEYVKKLKAHNLCETNSFAFMFACIGRGEGLYGEPDVESSIFKKHFPNTPLFGFFGNGEFGFDFVTGMDRKSEEMPQRKRRKSQQPPLYHSYTTVLVLVSIK